MVVEMEERELRPLRTDDNKHSIHKIVQLRRVEKPDESGYVRFGSLEGVAEETILANNKSDVTTSHCHVRGKCYLRDVVRDLHSLKRVTRK